MGKILPVVWIVMFFAVLGLYFQSASLVDAGLAREKKYVEMVNELIVKLRECHGVNASPQTTPPGQ